MHVYSITPLWCASPFRSMILLVNDPTVTTLANSDNLNMQYMYMPTAVISQLQLSRHLYARLSGHYHCPRACSVKQEV